MPAEFVALTCPNCGAKLDLYPDIDRFACLYCGAEMMVLKRGGTIALHAIGKALQQVAVNTDKAAAELALLRLERESNELARRIAAIRRSRNWEAGNGAGCAILALFVGSVFVAASITGGWWVLLFAAIAAAGVVTGASSKNRELSALESRLQSVRVKVREKKQIAEA